MKWFFEVAGSTNNNGTDTEHIRQRIFMFLRERTHEALIYPMWSAMAVIIN